jgi:hypothetical protein
LDQFTERSRDLFDRHFRIGMMEIQQVDAVGPKPPKHSLHRPTDIFRLAVAAYPLVVLEPKTQLTGDDNLVAKRRERFTDDLFVGEGAVYFGYIKEGDATLPRATNDPDHLLLVAWRVVVAGHVHTAKPKG